MSYTPLYVQERSPGEWFAVLERRTGWLWWRKVWIHHAVASTAGLYPLVWHWADRPGRPPLETEIQLEELACFVQRRSMGYWGDPAAADLPRGAGSPSTF